jgi:hypothetical protein
MKRRLAALALLAAAFACGAQARGRESEERRFGILVALSAPEGIDAAKYSDALAAVVSRSGLVGRIELASAPDDLVQEAGMRGLDAALGARIEVSEAGIRLSWRVLGAASGESLAEGSSDSPRPDARALSDRFWRDLVSSLDAALESSDKLDSARLAVSGPPGAVIAGIAEEPIVMPAEGEAVVSVRAPGTYAWHASAPGYDSARGVVEVLSQKTNVLAVAMARQRRWTVDAGIYNGAFVDAWASYRLRDDSLFVRAGLRQYALGFSLARAEVGYDPKLILSLPLLQPGVGGGLILGEPGRALRPYAGVLATTRIAFPKGAGIFIDPVAPLCLEAFGGLEWKPLPRWGFFAELYADFYPFADDVLLAASVKKAGGPSPMYAFGDGWAFSMPDFRFGARFYI